MNKDICCSGGAEGADIAWGKAAAAAGHTVIHFSFGKPKTKGGIKCYILDDKQLKEADRYLKIANKTLKRTFPARFDSTNNLLRRNYYQVYRSKSLYAIINGFDEKNPNVVNGGTAWAVQMFIDKMEINPCCVFNQLDNTWYAWSYFWDAGWEKMENPPLTPKGIWTGIGTRKLTPEGEAAISSIFGEKQND